MIWNQLALVFPVLFVIVHGQGSTPKADVIVQLFQWPWDDVATLCRDYLASRPGIGAVQVSPPQPHRIINRPLRKRDIQRPWWERYQPTSLSIGDTRSGTAQQFKDMVNICKQKGVEVYTEIVINHLLAGDAGLGRSTDKKWFNVNERDFSLKIDEVLVAGISGAKSAQCAEGTPLRPENCAEPVYTLEEEAGALLKLNLSHPYVQAQIKGFLQSLIDVGITGFSVISPSLSTREELQTVLGQLLYDANGDPTGPNTLTYLELADTSPLEDELLSDYIPTDDLDLRAFSYGSAAVIGNRIRMGATAPDEDGFILQGVQTIFFDLEGFAIMARKIMAFEHHEQLHGRSNSNQFASLEPLTASQQTIATLLMLISNPEQAGTPRLVWDYRVSPALHWQGPPTMADLTVTSPFDPVSSGWNKEFEKSWIFQVAELRWKWFFENRIPIGFLAVERTVHYELTSQSSQDSDTAVLVFLVPIDVIRRPADFIPGECTVGLVLMSIHREGSAFNGNEPTLPSGSYVLTGTVLEGELSLFENEVSVCGQNIVTDYEVLGSRDCVSLRKISGVDEGGLGETEVILPQVSQYNNPRFYIFEVKISSPFICSLPAKK